MMTHKLDLISKLLFTSLLIGHLIVYSSGQQYDSPSSINSVDNNRFFMNPNNIYPSNNAFFATSVFPPSSPEIRACYDSLGRAQRCVPAFENAAYMRRVEASNTCGEKVEGRTEFCVQTPKANPSQSRPQYTCNWCQRGQHEARNVNDFNDNSTDVTWWQSDTMFDGIEYPKTVNITLHLGKSYDVTYIRLVFQSPRPESFAIYKRETEDGPWVPFQFYSASCKGTYNMSVHSGRLERPDQILCLSDYSDISPLTGGNVVFSTMENRPGSYSFDRDPLLQKFVTATDIRIVLLRHNTFGDEIFQDSQVLKTYYYAISDLSVGGRCKCNGHSSECIPEDPAFKKYRCKCEHNTTGTDCDRCLDLFNDAPSGVATLQDAHECKPCNCNNRASKCEFDRDLYEKTGHGGRCIDCIDNFDGPNCERCKEGFYEDLTGHCVPCNCDQIGSLSTKCSIDGQCICKTGVDGRRCDRCAANFYEFSLNGCRPCGCSIAGSFNNTPTCNPYNGDCICKDNVEGRKCDKCKPGFFDLQTSNEFGCLPCFCYGHSSTCQSAGDYSKFKIESNFYKDAEKWTAKNWYQLDYDIQHNPTDHTIALTGRLNDDKVYFVAPNRYLGDQKASYNQYLRFTLRVSENDAIPNFGDIIIDGAGLTISLPITAQGNPVPDSRTQSYKFRLHEHPKFEWSPQLSSKDFISVLANITSVKIRGSYDRGGSGYIDEVSLESAQRIPGGSQATWIERCTCPDGYEGQFCESCRNGYRHDPPKGGSFAVCLPCQCNGFADFCDPYTGRCICNKNTGGENCEVCARGYYGNPLSGVGCTKCPCPDDGPCVLLQDETIVCLECPVGSGGARCEHCIDGFFGDPSESKPCKKCDCKGNTDENAVGNCDPKTGECTKCVFNTGGKHCERCLPGYFGDALALPKGDCRDCNCHHSGTMQSDQPITNPLLFFNENSRYVCDDRTGHCSCKPNVMGRQCDRCMEGYFNLTNPEGCVKCECNIIGSLNHTCNEVTGQCHCRPGVVGIKCDKCAPLHYGFSEKGCQKCDCDTIGSKNLQCRPNGQCECLPNVEGRRCERCRENKFNREAGCIDCPPCYGLIQESVNTHRSKLNQLKGLLEEIENNRSEVEDKSFETSLQELIYRANKLLDEARRLGSDGKSLQEQLLALKNRLSKIQEMAKQIDGRMNNLESLIGYAKGNMSRVESILERGNGLYLNAKRTFDYEARSALERARERFRRFGMRSAKMSQISEEATALMKRHKQDGDKIRELVMNAVNNSETASKLVQDAIGKHSSNREEIRRIQDQLVETTDLLERTRKMSEESLKEALRAREDSVRLFTEANSITLPTADAVKMRVDAKELIDQARKIMRDAAALLSRYENVLNGTQIQIGDLRSLLKDAMDQQEITAKLLATVDASHNQARQAAQSANATLLEATSTLETLKRFDGSVRESREKAQEALKKVPEIRKIVQEAEKRTEEAQAALSGAQSDALHAKNTAIKAKEVAENASEEAKKIRDEAARTKDRARQVKIESDALNRTIGEGQTRLRSYEEQADTDDKLSQEAQERANQAKTSAQEAKNKVDGAMKLVNDILNTLNGLDSVDGGQLRDLEDRLSQAEAELRMADLNNRTSSLKDAREFQTSLVNNYANEIEQLRRDVANIKAISEAIPKDCMRRMRLEP